jgi:ketohexokinase
MANIIAIGNATLDIINQVATYPKEDSENRALDQRMVMGGNAANSLRVLKQLNHQCAFIGVLAYDAFGHFIKDELARLEISSSKCMATDGRTPTSYITLSQENGSRSIVHYRDLPELDANHFTSVVTPEHHHWFHFQGRDNICDLRQMMAFIHVNKNPSQRVSLEIEKPFPDIESLEQYADTVFYSKDYVRSQGVDSPEAWLDNPQQRATHALRVCAWGKRGAMAEDNEGNRVNSQAFEPESVVDTIGAGDTFNAGFIDAQCRGLGLDESIIHACRLAGKKCGQLGFDDLANVFQVVNSHD